MGHTIGLAGCLGEPLVRPLCEVLVVELQAGRL
jgi:predicted DNA-binding protein with PD1-like motif